MIMESDKHTGVVRKHYIGMVTMLDILAQMAGHDRLNGGDEMSDLDRKMSVPVSSIIGHCLEGLSLWTLNPNTRCALSLIRFDLTLVVNRYKFTFIQVFSKGIHRALVPVDGNMENVSGVELVESASSYQMLTQMDLLKFLRDNASDIQGILSRNVWEIGAVNETVFGITDHTKVIDAIKCMRAALLNAVPIVVAMNSQEDDSRQLINGKGRKLIGTFSAADLGGCHLSSLQTWLPLTALEFTEHIAAAPIHAAPSSNNLSPREIVTCYPDSPLDEVITEFGSWIANAYSLDLFLLQT
ncbi:hypothetical protein K2173_017277 [Erythroxylum novogranatense]|uniref:CBS domain-containing protein n=1 Tax=Erythroxylum novogranatense TaxID=1862640 RepID=A0AAV8U6A4_9ROSI|nr:hypothetical protein K2173_017277 [Erythroxylum novogranatense]